MTGQSTSDTIAAFIRDKFCHEEAFTEETDLFDAGVIDSAGVLELVTFIETRFGFQISDNELLPENLHSIAGIAKLVASKRP
jgi:acyl carrier protein